MFHRAQYYPHRKPLALVRAKQGFVECYAELIACLGLIFVGGVYGLGLHGAHKCWGWYISADVR